MSPGNGRSGFAAAVGLALVATVAFVPTASASFIAVDTTADMYRVGGSPGCALREAIHSATINSSTGGCTAGTATTDLISVPPGTYALTLAGVDNLDAVGDLDISGNGPVQIAATGPGLTTISCSSCGDRLLHSTSSDLTFISGIRFTGGSTTGNGGAILNAGTGALVLNDVTVDANTADGNGGGVFSTGVIDFNNVTISGNSADGSGGGLAYNNNTTNSIAPNGLSNSTVVANTADAGPGGGVANLANGLLGRSNTIIADNQVNTPQIANPAPDCSGQIQSGGYNITGSGDNCTLFGGATGDLTGTNASPIPANLAALADNGGSVLTRLPARTSPAVNRGYPGTGAQEPCEPQDARGSARPQDGRCDIGALEAGSGVQTLPVTTTVDEFDGGFAGACSLREAVDAANTNQAKGGCPAGGTVTDQVELANPGTYALTLAGVDNLDAVGDLDISGNGPVQIAATGPGLTTISCSSCGDRLLHSTSSDLTFISGIRFTGGSTTGNGGAILNAGTGALVLNDVTVDANTADGNGGGVFSTGVIDFNNVTISGNSADGSGGGLAYNNNTTNSIAPNGLSNSTVVANTADAGPGGGVANLANGLLGRSNTIIADNQVNTPQIANPAPDCSGQIQSGGYNITGSGDNCTLFGGATGDLTGTNASPIPANLAALADNGGSVLTRLPARTSPAVNRGYPGTGAQEPCEPQDARGSARPQDGRCDIGALEAGSGVQTLPVTTTVDEFDGGFAGACSLREAVDAANTNQAKGGCPAGGTVTDQVELANPGTYALTRAGVEDANAFGDLDLLTGNIQIGGTGAGQTTIDANDLDRVIDVSAASTGGLIGGVNIRNGTTAGSGGGVRVAGELALRGVTVSGNVAGGDGGGIQYAGTAQGNISNSTISGNLADGDGGGMISVAVGAPQVNDVTVTQNTADVDLVGAQGGGGVAGFPGGQIANTIVAGNTDASTGDTPDCFGILNAASHGHNLIGIGNAGDCGFAAAGDQVGSNAAPVLPGLGPLADNGGRTLTHAPVFGSPALNAGNPATPGSPPACLSDDQLGTLRPLAGRCDVGAIEIDPAPPVPADPLPVDPVPADPPLDDVPPNPPPDTTPPDTNITKQPLKPVRVRKRKAMVQFGFASSEADSTLQCKLDNKSLTACSSPTTYKLKSGKHTFTVQATDAAGNVDPTPAQAKFRVKRARRRA